MAALTVGQLIEMLSQYPDSAPVQLMFQPNYPFKHALSHLISEKEIAEEEGEEWPKEGSEAQANPEIDTEDPDYDPNENVGTVYLVDGGQLDYGTKKAWNR